MSEIGASSSQMGSIGEQLADQNAAKELNAVFNKHSGSDGSIMEGLNQDQQELVGEAMKHMLSTRQADTDGNYQAMGREGLKQGVADYVANRHSLKPGR